MLNNLEYSVAEDDEYSQNIVNRIKNRIYDINDEIISTEYVDSIDYSSKDENILYIDNGHICGKNVGKAEVEITVRRDDDDDEFYGVAVIGEIW